MGSAQFSPQGNPNNSSASRPSETPSAVTGAGGALGPTQSAPAQVATEGPSRPPAPSQGAGARLVALPVWALIAALVIAALIFGGGFAIGHATTTDIEQTTISVIHNTDPSVVQVQGRGGGPGGSVGSGEILTSNGYIVTNSHVVHGLSSFTALLASGQSVPATLVGDVPSQDLAVLKVNMSNLTPIAVGDSSQVQVGAFDIAMGSPLGLEQSATTGIVSALNRDANEQVDGKVFTLTGMIQTSAPINPGNSGGALVNLKGQLIGIPTLAAVEPATQVAANGIGFAISSNKMESIVAPFLKSGG